MQWFKTIIRIKIRLLLSCTFASWLEAGNSRATTGRAEESGLSETSSLHDLFHWAACTMSTKEQGLIAPGLLPVYKMSWRLQTERTKRNGEKERGGSLGALSEATQEICGFQVSQPLAPVEGVCWFQWLFPKKPTQWYVDYQLSPKCPFTVTLSFISSW